VLVLGGEDNLTTMTGAVEIFEPRSATWTSAAPMNLPRVGATATLLRDGKVLVAGGVDRHDEAVTSAELYDPAADRWTYTGSLAQARYWHTAETLPDGRVVALGGAVDDWWMLTTDVVEAYDPATGAWAKVAPMPLDRANHASAVLANGKVVVTGGWMRRMPPPPGGYMFFMTLDDVRVYDPEHDAWSTGAMLPNAPMWHTATVTVDGRVLVVGGLESHDLVPRLTYETLAGAGFIAKDGGAWRAAPRMQEMRMQHTATRLLDGGVLVVGGILDHSTLGSVEVLR
jgi:N-acetylneuraminic acid mutarotase